MFSEYEGQTLVCKRCLTTAEVKDGRLRTRDVNCYWSGHAESEYLPSKLFSVGHNMAGYMPESDIYVMSDFESAKQSLVADIESLAESLWSGLTGAPITTLTDEQRERLSYSEPEAKVCLDHAHADITDRDKETLEQVLSCDYAIKEVNSLVDAAEFSVYIDMGSYNLVYWINEVDRNDLQIPAILEGELLDQELERVNGL